MKTTSFLCFILIGLLLVNCKKDDHPAAVAPVRITAPADGSMVHDTVPILFSISSSLQVARLECYVDYQLTASYDTVPANLWFYASRYSKGSLHHYSLMVITVQGESYASNTVSMTISMLTKPKVTVTSESKSEVTLTWVENSFDREGYRIKRRTGYQNFTVIAQLGPGAYTYTDNTIDTNRTYSYLVEVFSVTDQVDSDTVNVAYFLNRYKSFTDYVVPSAVEGQVAIAPDGRKVVITNYWDATFTVINTVNGVQVSLPETGGTQGLAMSHSGSFFVTGGTHDWDLIKVWDLNTLTLIREFDSESANYSLVTNQADDRLVVGGEPVRIYNIADGSLVTTYSVENAYCRSTQFSQKEASLLTGSNDHLVKIYNTFTGELIRTFTGHTAQVGTAIYTPDESKVISGSYEEPTVRIWEAATGNLLKTITMKSPTVKICNGKNGEIIIGSQNGTITVMDQQYNVIQAMKDFQYLLYIDYKPSLDMIAGYGSVTTSRVKLFKKFGHWEVI